MKTRVFIYGSCVSRDAFEIQENVNFEVCGYYARSSFASSYSIVPCVVGPWINTIESNFQKKMIRQDFENTLQRDLERMLCDIELLLVDIMDERFNLYQLADDQLYTISKELTSTSIEHQGGSIIARMSDGYFQLWERGWSHFVSKMIEYDSLHKVIVNKTFYATKTDNFTDFNPKYSQEYINKANIFLNLLYARMEKDLSPEQFIIFPDAVICGKESHKWGKNPFHYVDDYYKFLIRELVTKIFPLHKNNFFKSRML